MSAEPTLETVVALLDDEYARRILTETRDQPMSANELADRCDASLSTICRRLDRLEAAGFVHERTRLRDDGNHDEIYTAALSEVCLRLEADGFTFDLSRHEEDVADRLHRLWGDL